MKYDYHYYNNNNILHSPVSFDGWFYYEMIA